MVNYLQHRKARVSNLQLNKLFVQIAIFHLR